MDRGEDVVADDAFGNENRILEVVAVPGHEGDEHVAAQRQFAQFGGRPVGYGVADFDPVADIDQGALMQRRVLVGTLILQKIVDIDAGSGMGFLGGVDNDTGGVHLIDGAGTARRYGGA